MDTRLLRARGRVMGEEDIKRKLRDLIGSGLGAADEPRVVYVMVEIRKILEHENSEDQHPYLRFYADWTLHTKKTRSFSDQVLAILATTYKAAAEIIVKVPVDDDPVNSPTLDFAEMKWLREELQLFLEARGIPAKLTASDEDWRTFARHLIHIIEGQPLQTKNGDIEEIRFQEWAKDVVICLIRFRRPIAGKNSYAFNVAF